MEPWYKVVEPRKEVREGRSFNPDEFAIALEQVVAGTAPADYKDPHQFFSRTCFTRALREHAGMALRRLAGQTERTAPVLTLITQFGGGKTHTLTALYHLVRNADRATGFPGITELIFSAGLPSVPAAQVAVFVGNAWDPQEGKETPWIDLARQLAGDQGVAILGPSARSTPPGTEAISRLFEAAGGSVLILFDEVLNFVNRHRNMAEPFHAFIQNLTVATTGTTRAATLIGLPRSQVEMTDWDLQWQDKITKVVRRVATDLIVNDEAEISEVIRRRLFENLGSERIRKNVAQCYADWCFERRAQLPPQWTTVDSASKGAKARELLKSHFEACYPFHPATLSVFQRKWQALPQYQQTRGTLAMLAQWISWAYRDGFHKARKEPLLTLGSAPMHVPEFRSVILGQLGEPRLLAAIESDVSGPQSHATALDADTKGALRDIHRRVATTILFECSGGQVDKVAHLPELRFAIGEPEVDTTSVDSAALSLEAKAFFTRKMGTDGFQIRHQPTLKKVVNDRRASLDENADIKPAMAAMTRKEFERGASLPIVYGPTDSSEVQDSPKLTLVVMDPDSEWSDSSSLRQHISDWTKNRGKSPRLYPGSLVWCLKKTGRDLREKIESFLAWKRVAKEVAQGTLGTDIDRAEVHSKVTGAEEAALDEVWAGYRFLILADNQEPDGLRVIDLGAGHASGSETLCGRVITALKSQALLNESVGAGYIDRNWPVALKDAGAWSLTSLRQCFLNGSLTRLVDPDSVLRSKIKEFVAKGDFGLAYDVQPNGTYQRFWYCEDVPTEEVAFESNVFLLSKSKAKRLAETPPPQSEESPRSLEPRTPLEAPPIAASESMPEQSLLRPPRDRLFRLSGAIPSEVWNRLGTKLIPKLKSGTNLLIRIDLSAEFPAAESNAVRTELRQVLEDLGIGQSIRLDDSND